MSLSSNPRRDVYQFGDFEVRRGTREFLRAGELVALSPKVFDLLVMLLDQRDRVLDKAELLRALWPRLAVSRGALPQAVLKLRKAMGVDDASDPWITTVKGVGYRFVGEVRQFEPRALAGDEQRRPVDPAGRLPADQLVIRHAVDALVSQGWEQLTLLQDAVLARTIDLLLDKQWMSSEPKARFYGLLYRHITQRGSADAEDLWVDLQTLRRLADELDLLEVRVAMEHCLGTYLFLYSSPAEAIPVFHQALDGAAKLPGKREAAQSAFYLAACFGRSADPVSCAHWTDQALMLAAQAQPAWFKTYCLALLAGTWVNLGEHEVTERNLDAARKRWSRSVAMLEEAAASPFATQYESIGRFVRMNLAWAEGYLHAHRRRESIRTFRELIEIDTAPRMKLCHLLGLARFLCEEGQLDEARRFCEEGLALGDASGLARHRTGFLEVAADIASRQGRHADAVRSLRDLIHWQSKASRDEAVKIAKVTALRLKTTEAVALAEATSRTLQEVKREYAMLEGQARVFDIASRLDQDAGAMTRVRFTAWLEVAASQARNCRQGLPLIVIEIDADAERSAGASAALNAGLRQVLRSGDRWSRWSDRHWVVALAAALNDKLPLAVSRLRRELVAALGAAGQGGAGGALRIRSIDAAAEGSSVAMLDGLSCSPSGEKDVEGELDEVGAIRA